MLKILKKKRDLEISEAIEKNDDEKALLSLFLMPRNPNEIYHKEKISTALGKSINKTIKSFIKQGLLEEAKTEQKLSIMLGVSDLKNILREHKLKVSGKKGRIN